MAKKSQNVNMVCIENVESSVVDSVRRLNWPSVKIEIMDEDNLFSDYRVCVPEDLAFALGKNISDEVRLFHADEKRNFVTILNYEIRKLKK